MVTRSHVRVRDAGLLVRAQAVEDGVSVQDRHSKSTQQVLQQERFAARQSLTRGRAKRAARACRL
eukprot:6213217-Pleurochrysis_carterae.AAC.3